MGVEDIKKIIEIAVNAPSGGNSQPWKFEIKNNKVYIIGLPEKDHPILNYHNRGTWIAHGALLQNIIIAATHFGYKVEYEIFPNKEQSNITAVVTFLLVNQEEDKLFSSVSLRTTNRKKYSNKLLDSEQKKELLDSISGFKEADVVFVENSQKRISIGRALADNEIITLENQKLHELFFKEIVWSREEESTKKSGLYLKAMELKKPQQAVLKMLRKWKIMSLFNYLKFSRLIAKDNSQIYSSGAGVFVIVVDNKDEDFLLAGRIMEKLWLKATQMGLSCHPIAGIMFYWQGLNDNIDLYSENHKKIINNAYNTIAKICDLKKGTIAMSLRVGFSDQPSATSSKRIPEIKVISN